MPGTKVPPVQQRAATSSTAKERSQGKEKLAEERTKLQAPSFSPPPLPPAMSYESWISTMTRLFGGARNASVQPWSPSQGSAPIQMDGAGSGGDASQIHSAASVGLQGQAAPLPFLSTIQRVFGHHDLSNVKAHSDEMASTGSSLMGAQAFTRGDHVAFAKPPSLRTVAHEAAHVVQQRSGVNVAEGVGKQGDAYEQHADAVANLVAEGRPAGHLLDRVPGHSPGSSSGANRSLPSTQMMPVQMFADYGGNRKDLLKAAHGLVQSRAYTALLQDMWKLRTIANYQALPQSAQLGKKIAKFYAALKAARYNCAQALRSHGGDSQVSDLLSTVQADLEQDWQDVSAQWLIWHGGQNAAPQIPPQINNAQVANQTNSNQVNAPININQVSSQINDAQVSSNASNNIQSNEQINNVVANSNQINVQDNEEANDEDDDDDIDLSDIKLTPKSPKLHDRSLTMMLLMPAPNLEDLSSQHSLKGMDEELDDNLDIAHSNSLRNESASGGDHDEEDDDDDGLAQDFFDEEDKQISKQPSAPQLNQDPLLSQVSASNATVPLLGKSTALLPQSIVLNNDKNDQNDKNDNSLPQAPPILSKDTSSALIPKVSADVKPLPDKLPELKKKAPYRQRVKFADAVDKDSESNQSLRQVNKKKSSKKILPPPRDLKEASSVDLFNPFLKHAEMRRRKSHGHQGKLATGDSKKALSVCMDSVGRLILEAGQKGRPNEQEISQELFTISTELYPFSVAGTEAKEELDEGFAIEAQLGEKVIQFMLNSWVPLQRKVLLWRLSEAAGHPLHNSVVSYFERGQRQTNRDPHKGNSQGAPDLNQSKVAPIPKEIDKNKLPPSGAPIPNPINQSNISSKAAPIPNPINQSNISSKAAPIPNPINQNNILSSVAPPPKLLQDDSDKQKNAIPLPPLPPLLKKNEKKNAKKDEKKDDKKNEKKDELQDSSEHDANDPISYKRKMLEYEERQFTDLLIDMYGANLDELVKKTMLPDDMEQASDEAAEMREYMRRNTMLARILRSGETTAHENYQAEVHPNFWGLFVTPPQSKEEIEDTRKEKGTFKIHSPWEKGVHIFNTPGHTRALFMRAIRHKDDAPVSTFVTKGGGLDLNQHDEAYDSSFLPRAQKGREDAPSKQQLNEQTKPLSLFQYDPKFEAHEHVGYGEWSMSKSDFPNFDAKQQNARRLANLERARKNNKNQKDDDDDTSAAFDPLVNSLAQPMAVATIANTVRNRPKLDPSVLERADEDASEMPTQITTVAPAETSRRMHRSGVRADQYRWTSVLRVPEGKFYLVLGKVLPAKNTNIIASEKGKELGSAKSGDVVLSVVEFDNVKDANAAWRWWHAPTDKFPENQGNEIKLRAEGEWFDVKGSPGVEPGVVLGGGAELLTYKNPELEIADYKKATKIMRDDLKIPAPYREEVDQNVRTNYPQKQEESESQFEKRIEPIVRDHEERVDVGYTLMYSIVGSLALFLQEGDSSGGIGNSFESRNISSSVRDADEWGKGQLRIGKNKASKEIDGIGTYVGQDLFDTRHSLRQALLSAGVDQNIAPLLWADMEQLQELFGVVMQEVLSGLEFSGEIKLGKGDEPKAKRFRNFQERLIATRQDAQKNDAQQQQQQPDDSKAQFWNMLAKQTVKNSKNQDVPFDVKDLAELETFLEKADLGALKERFTFDDAIGNISDEKRNWLNAKFDFRVLLQRAFREFVFAPNNLPPGLRGMARLFEGLE